MLLIIQAGVLRCKCCEGGSKQFVFCCPQVNFPKGMCCLIMLQKEFKLFATSLMLVFIWFQNPISEPVLRLSQEGTFLAVDGSDSERRAVSGEGWESGVFILVLVLETRSLFLLFSM